MSEQLFSTNEEEPQQRAGIYIFGKVRARTRKQINGTYRYTYLIDAGHIELRVYCWGEHEFMPVRYEMQERILINPYLAKGNRPMYALYFKDVGEASTSFNEELF